MIQQTDIDTNIDDIHRMREKLAAKFGGDIRAILDDARRRQAESQRPTFQRKSPNNPANPIGTSIAN